MESKGAAHDMRGGNVRLSDLQGIIFEQMRALQAVDPRDAAAVEGVCAVSEAVRGLAGVAVDNANTALRAHALMRDMKLAGADAGFASTRMLEA